MSKLKSEGGGSNGSSTDNKACPEVLVVDLEEEDDDADIKVKLEPSTNQNGDEPSSHTSLLQPANDGSIPNGKAAPAAEDSAPDLLEVFPMTYHNIRLKMFKVLGSPCRYFYSPLVMLDPRSIQAQVDKATGQAYVRFTIQMWDTEVEGQVLKWLKRLPESEDVEDYCVQTMPYEEIRLVMRSGSMASTAFRTPKFPTAYHGLNQTLQFHLSCESKEIADSVAESFKSDPAFAIQDLALECTSFEIGSTSAEPRRKFPRVEVDAGMQRRSLTYLKLNVRSPDDVPANDSKVPSQQHLEQQLEDLKKDVQQMKTQLGGIKMTIKAEYENVLAELGQTMEPKTVVPLFSAAGLETNPLDGPVTFQRVELDQTHGAFDESTGLFTVHTAGLYLFLFNGTSWLDGEEELKCPTRVELRVDDQLKASSEVGCWGKDGTVGYNLAISAIVPLDSGSVIGVFTTKGCLASLNSEGQDSYTRFCGILLQE